MQSKLHRQLPDPKSLDAADVNVRLAIIDIKNEPLINWRQYGLDPNVQDDRLIASTILFKDDHTDKRVIIVSGDFGMRRKSSYHDMETLDPAKAFVQNSFKSQVEQELEDSKLELQTLKSRAVKLDIMFAKDGSHDPLLTLVRGSERGEYDSTETLDAESSLLLEQMEDEVKQSAQYHTDRSDIERFEEVYPHYVRDLRVIAERNRAKKHFWRYDIEFVTMNGGETFATDVEMTMTFPKDTFVVGIADEYDDIDGFGGTHWILKPFNPWKYKNRDQYRYLLPVRIPEQPWSIAYDEEPEPQTTSSGPHYRDDRNRVSFHTPKLRASTEWALPSIVIYLPPTESGGFKVECVINADQLTRPLVKNLNVKLVDS